MSEEINTAFLLMGVGMITVFIVLLCVVVLGNILINFVNKFVPAPSSPTAKQASPAEIPASKIAAITSAIEVFTKGKGQITSIKKLD
ncbi:MAG: OadG family protein [Reichenbachiella sp.]